ncbi:hypothetical protein [Stygiobacter electus]|jgi:hypothetical protein|uniref:Uncharacterized protein n=1 Tax=Stygiobacter electus TaxID=3032292 RepID=A0AAE3NXS7_9BACT|nr:hypothetical protein [Stygiobacter electus]MDF1610692.1 hypothetical protein [Stygiobacter electus]
MNNKLLTCFILLLYFSTGSFSQSKEDWVKIFENGKLVFIDKANITSIDNEIFVWAFEQYNEPIDLKEIGKDIYFIKTRYVIDKEISRYKIDDVIYFDRDKNVVKSFHYNSSYQDPIYKYNLPIIENSEMEIILKKCLEFTTH